MYNEHVLVEKLRQLPQEQLSEVIDFVDFLMSKTRRTAAMDRLLSVAPALEAAGAAPLSEEEAVTIVNAVRASHRQ